MLNHTIRDCEQARTRTLAIHLLINEPLEVLIVMKVTQLLFCFCLVAVQATNNLELVPTQKNITSDQTLSFCYESYFGTHILVGGSHYFSIWVRDTFSFKKYASFSLGDTVQAGLLDWYASHIVILGSSNLYNYYRRKSDFELIQTIHLTGQPTALSWTYSNTIVLIGYNNGSISTFVQDDKTQKYLWRQTIHTNHESIGKIDSKTASFVSCGANDSIINVYVIDYQTQLFTLKQTIPETGVGRCTSILMSIWERIIVVGRSTGQLYFYEGTDTFTLKYSRKAHSKAVKVIQANSDTSVLLTAGEQGSLSMWTKTDDYTNALSTFQTKVVCSKWVYATAEFLVGAPAGNTTLFKLNATECEGGAQNPSHIGSCTCTSGRIWKNSNCTKVDCSVEPFSTGQADKTGSCICQPGYNLTAKMQKCTVGCALDYFPNSNGSIALLDVCYCRPGCTWNKKIMACEVNCSQIYKANGNLNETVCRCSQEYDWDAKTTSCLINCSSFNNSVIADFPKQDSCECKPGFTWKAAIPKCDVMPVVDCSKIVDALPQYVNDTVCYCKTGFLWSIASWKCVADCSIIEGSNGTDGKGGCICLQGLTYLPVQKVCTVAVNCSNVLNSPGTNKDNRTCNCNTGYFYGRRLEGDKMVGVCRKQCWRYAKAIDNDDDADYLSCGCPWGYVWSKEGCIINCHELPHSTDKNISVDSCECNAGYKWHQKQFECSAGSNMSTAVGLAIGIPLGLIALTGIGAIGWNFYKSRAQVVSDPPDSAGQDIPPSTDLRLSTAKKDDPIVEQIGIDSPVRRPSSVLNPT